MPKYALSKWFARGNGRIVRYHDSRTLLVDWNGRPDGAAFDLPDPETGRSRYRRNDATYRSLAALLRAIEAEHTEAAP